MAFNDHIYENNKKTVRTLKVTAKISQRTSAAPIHDYQVGIRSWSSAIERCSGSGMHAVDMNVLSR